MVFLLALPEAASEAIESLLTAQTCPVHVETTTESGFCEMCLLDEQSQHWPADLDARERHMLAYHPFSESDPCIPSRTFPAKDLTGAIYQPAAVTCTGATWNAEDGWQPCDLHDQSCPRDRGSLDCDSCGVQVPLRTDPRDLVIVLCAACNRVPIS